MTTGLVTALGSITTDHWVTLTSFLEVPIGSSANDECQESYGQQSRGRRLGNGRRKGRKELMMCVHISVWGSFSDNI